MTDEGPRRIQRKRTKGWRMPVNTVYVGRPSRFGNDWTVRDAKARGIMGETAQRAWAVAAFRRDVDHWRTLPWACFHPDVMGKLLRGKNLACFVRWISPVMPMCS